MVRTCLPAAVLVLLTCTGCGFLEDLATPEPVPLPPTAVPTTAPPSPPIPPPVEVLAVALEDDRAFPFAAELSVLAGPPLEGLPPLGGGFGADCGLADDATTQYLPVEVLFANRSEAVAALAAGVELLQADGSPAGAAGTGLFTASGEPTTRYCQNGSNTPSTDHFAIGADAHAPASVWLYLVRQAPTVEEQVGAATIFSALELRFRNVENRTGSVPGPWAVGHWTAARPATAGGPCPEDPGALCAPLTGK